MSEHKVNSLQHPRGEHALWQEVCRLRGLLREGDGLVADLDRQLSDHHRSAGAIGRWRSAVRKELGRADESSIAAPPVRSQSGHTASG